MKGHVSERLELVLRDPEARAQLQSSLIGRGEGTVRVNGSVYRVTRYSRSIPRADRRRSSPVPSETPGRGER